LEDSVPTPIEAELMEQMKAAMRGGDKRATAAIRMVRTKIMEARTAKNAKELDDDDVLAILRGYVKSLEAALAEFRANNTPEDDENVVQLSAEVALFEPYMPKFKGEAETAALVDAAIAELGASSRREAGRVMGMLMKAHKGELDAALVRSLVDARLSA
jgi:uncharacterized protein YqeY